MDGWVERWGSLPPDNIWLMTSWHENKETYILVRNGWYMDKINKWFSQAHGSKKSFMCTGISCVSFYCPHETFVSIVICTICSVFFLFGWAFAAHPLFSEITNVLPVCMCFLFICRRGAHYCWQHLLEESVKRGSTFIRNRSEYWPTNSFFDYRW